MSANSQAKLATSKSTTQVRHASLHPPLVPESNPNRRGPRSDPIAGAGCRAAAEAVGPSQNSGECRYAVRSPFIFARAGVMNGPSWRA